MLPGMPAAPERPRGDDRTRRRSWTVRARQLVSEGIHPLTRDRARPDLGTCGGCAHRFTVDHARSYPKCALGPRTGGEQTDIRAWWPACSRFEPGDRASDDAAR